MMKFRNTDITAMADWSGISLLQSVAISSLSDWGQHGMIFAQTFEDNLGSNVGDALQNFIDSGQVWALGVGFVLGYIVRSLTSY